VGKNCNYEQIYCFFTFFVSVEKLIILLFIFISILLWVFVVVLRRCRNVTTFAADLCMLNAAVGLDSVEHVSLIEAHDQLELAGY